MNPIFATDLASNWVAFGNVGALLAMGYYFLSHLEKKDANLANLVKQWQDGDESRTERIERIADKFDGTVRQFQAEQRTVIDQQMTLHKSTIEAVTENTHALTALTNRVDGIEKRFATGGQA